MEVLSPEALVTAALDPMRLYKHLCCPVPARPQATSPMPSDARTPNKAGEPLLEAALRDSARGTVRAVAGQPGGISRREWGEEAGGGEGLLGTGLSHRQAQVWALAWAPGPASLLGGRKRLLWLSLQSHPAKPVASYQKGEHGGASVRHQRGGTISLHSLWRRSGL